MKPALASPWPGQLPPGEWFAEEKLDGIRVLVEVVEPLPMTDTPGVFCWSRTGKDRILPAQIRDVLREFPIGVYDGELIAGRGLHSYDVANLDNTRALKLALFDVLTTSGVDLTVRGTLPTGYRDRRGYLEALGLDDTGSVVVPFQEPLACSEDVWTIAEAVWELEGEGLILKEAESLYEPGKRLRSWIKIKQLRSAVLTFEGFETGLMGARSIAVLVDDDGNRISVKWKNLDWLEKAKLAGNDWPGRRVRIEFHERTPDGSYRHPRWDRWESDVDEAETLTRCSR